MSLDIFHLSDLHIGGHNLKFYTKKMSAYQFMKDIAVPQLIELGSQAENCVFILTGDVVDDGTREQMKLAHESLNPLIDKFKVLVVPGNHDYGRDGIFADPDRINDFSEIFSISKEFPIISEIDGHIFIGLNSMDCVSIKDWFAKGRLGKKQNDKAIEVIKSDSRDMNKKIIIYLHHHPFIFPDEMPWNLVIDWLALQLNDNNKFIRRLKDKVDVLLFGHQHRHLTFENTVLNSGYGIPLMCCTASLTKFSNEHLLDRHGYARRKILNSGFLLRKITIDDSGKISNKTLALS